MEMIFNNIVLDNFKHLLERFGAMEKECAKKLQNQGFRTEEIVHDRILHLRYDRTDCVLIVSR